MTFYVDSYLFYRRFWISQNHDSFMEATIFIFLEIAGTSSYSLFLHLGRLPFLETLLQLEPFGSSHSYTQTTLHWMMNEFKLVTLNVNGLRLAPKRKALFLKVRNTKADYVFLQEIHSTQQDQRIWLSQWGRQGIFAHGKSNSRGVCILFKQGLNPQITHTISDPEGRFLIVQIQRDEDIITLLNVYAPTQNDAINQLSLINDIHEKLGNLQIHTLLIAGDFNVQLGSTNTNVSPNTARYIDQIHALLEDYSLLDAWKHKYPTSKKGTFHRGV